MSGDGGSWETAFKAIQEGIDAASDADTVIVAQGTYVENIHFHGKNITLTSADPLDSAVVANTIIDGNKLGSVVTFSGTEDETCVIAGFTIRNGKAEYGGGIHGGPENAHTHARVENNTITANSAAFAGGLAYCDGTIRNNIILENSATFGGKYLGGGGLLRCNGAIENNIVARNSAKWCGGGLFECQGVIQNNVIAANSATDGGGLYRCHGIIQSNRISSNMAENSGGGIYDCDGTIRNNLVARNSAEFGGGLFWCKGVILSNTICENSAYCSGGIYGPGGPIRNCIIWGNSSSSGTPDLSPWSTPIYSCIQDWASGGEGNISENPGFAPGYRLSPDSPCIDAGKNEDWMWQAFDPDGNPRILTGISSMTVDMGAYEYAPGGPPTKRWYVNGSVAQSGDGSSWQAAFKTIQRGIDAASHGDTVNVAGGRYLENISFNGKNITLCSTDPTDPRVVAKTVIDGSQNGPVVSFLGTEDETCVLAGFTIRDGGGESGDGISGGVFKTRTHATIRGNIMSENSGSGLIYCDGVIQNNTVSGNSGAGLVLCFGTIQNNTIKGNTCSGLSYCHGTIRNNTICGNSADYGAGLYYCRGIILDCIIWGNLTREQLWNCSAPTYCCIERWDAGGEGNINYFPYFVDADNGDYHLQRWSPCIDAGDPASTFYNEPEPNGGRVDMGAYGNTPEATPKSGDADGDGLPDDWEIELFGDLAQGPNDDPDSDGMPNIEEYRRGFGPLTPLAVWHVDASLPVSGDGKTWQTAFTTIQEGIDAASERDTIIVAEGTYVENIRLHGRNIILTSTNPLDSDVVDKTTIDGNDAGPVVTFLATEDETCVLTGFSIQDGKAEYGGGICGGTYDYATRATISHNLIIWNEADDSGGGIAFCNGNICHNIVSENSADGGGGGLYRCDGAIEHNVIRWNSAGHGGGLCGCEGVIRNNIIWGNLADWGGGGLDYCGGIIQNNTVTANVAEYAGGLQSCWGTILNCIIWGNLPSETSQIVDSSEPAYCCIEEWMGGGEGSIAFTPYFDNEPWGDFHLKSWSPCIDAGDPSSPFSNEPEPNGGRVNMGAYGNTPEATSRPPDSDIDADNLPDGWELYWFNDLEQDADGDADGDRITNIVEYRYAWNPKEASITVVESLRRKKCYQTIQVALCESVHGDEIVVYPGFYSENIRFGGKNVVLRSTNPSDASVVASTIIDGGQARPAVTFDGTEDERCLLSGFTIQNGSAGICGGTWEIRTHATIEHNIITRNSPGTWGEGGGIYCADGTIRNNSICANSAGYGGGLYACDGTIENNAIFANTARDGGGLYSCHGIIQNNTISGNAAYRDDSVEAYGGGLAYCDGTIYNNVISGNSVTGWYAIGGGLYSCSGVLANNTIVGNSAWGGYAGGGGVAGCNGTILNCVIWGNTAPEAPQVWGSTEPTYSCIQDWIEGGEGNIAQEPLFFDPDGPDGDPKTFLDNNYRLSAESPCIDAGKNEDWMWAAVDLDGNPRVWGDRVDMGAYEYGSFPFQVVGVIGSSDGGAELTWNSRPGDTYTVWSCSGLAVGDWTEESIVASGGEIAVWRDPATTSSRKFYRIELK